MFLAETPPADRHSRRPPLPAELGGVAREDPDLHAGRGRPEVTEGIPGVSPRADGGHGDLGQGRLRFPPPLRGQVAGGVDQNPSGPPVEHPPGGGEPDDRFADPLLSHRPDRALAGGPGLHQRFGRVGLGRIERSEQRVRRRRPRLVPRLVRQRPAEGGVEAFEIGVEVTDVPDGEIPGCGPGWNRIAALRQALLQPRGDLGRRGREIRPRRGLAVGRPPGEERVEILAQGWSPLREHREVRAPEDRGADGGGPVLVGVQHLPALVNGGRPGKFPVPLYAYQYMERVKAILPTDEGGCEVPSDTFAGGQNLDLDRSDDRGGQTHMLTIV